VAQQDLEVARRHSKALRDLIVIRARGLPTSDARQRVDELLKRAWVVNDEACWRILMSIERAARALFSHERGDGQAPDALRLEILRELDAFDARLAAIALERSGATDGA
jgi:hypothetical protein